MANFEIPENPKYTEEIRKFDITDSAHAELFNGVIQALINNETFLKKIQEKHADDTEEQFQQQYEQLTGYTDTKIGQLINGAPETLDTIKEVADAILENETIIEALNEAIGKKLNKDGDISDATVAFTSEDTDESPTLWKDIGRIVSGKLKEILNRVSIMSNNLKYLRKLCGTTDVSKIADGTLTGIVNSLNTDIQAVNGLKYINFGDINVNTVTVDEFIKEILNGKIPLSLNDTYICSFTLGAACRIIIQPYTNKNYASAILFSYAFNDIIFYKKVNGVVTKIIPDSVKTII